MLGFRNGRFLVFFGKRLNSEQMKMKRSVNKNHSRIGFFFRGIPNEFVPDLSPKFSLLLLGSDPTEQQTLNIRAAKFW